MLSKGKTKAYSKVGKGWRHGLGGLVVLSCIALLPVLCWAGDDDFDFSDEGGGEGGDGFDLSAGGGGEGGDDFDFSDTTNPDDKGKAAANVVMPSGDKPIIAAFFDPVDETDPRVLDRLSDALLQHLAEFEDFDTVTGIIVKSELDGMDAEKRESCIADPACVSGLAKEFSLSKVVIGRISTVGLERPRISLDVIDVPTGAMENFIEFEASPRVKGQEKELRPAAYKLFNRKLPLDPVAGDSSGKGKKSEGGGLPTGQLIGAIGAGVAGMALVGVGVKFGLDATSIEDEITKGRGNGMTQKAAQTKLAEAQDAAVLSNVFYGLAGVAVATGVVLILIRPGEELADDQNQRSEVDFWVNPVLSTEGAGVMGGVRF